MKGDPLETLKIFREKETKMRILNGLLEPKTLKGEPLSFFSNHFVAEYQKN